ncbi:helix-turn-helix domain-containing protein [Actinoplanes sichuanensis]|uniref:HTH luxR-type domain-containing protein n=1 Tax=Actinoplanes sichuanensis TaxID=512349 RepID=A0ABW4ANF4_9ACTN|nr:hypothetical protein [Actinoplanes sichuanensis]
MTGSRETSRQALPEHLAEVLDQLASGATDLAACRKLGVSGRTYSRRVSELLDHLGVASRFQAGIVAARLGLAHDPAPQRTNSRMIRPEYLPHVHHRNTGAPER